MHEPQVIKACFACFCIYILHHSIIFPVIPIGVAKTEREGTDCTIVTFSRMVGTSLECAEILEKEGISVEVINLRYTSSKIVLQRQCHTA